MRIAVNTRLLLENKLDGIGGFTYETLRRICQKHPEHEFIFIFDRSFHSSFIFADNITPIVTGPMARHPLLWFLWFEFSVPRILKKFKADIFLSTDGYLSLSTSCPSIAVIHDINFYHRPFDLPLSSRWYYNYFFPRYAQKALKIGTVSEFSKADISASYQIHPEKIAVLYNGANEIYVPLKGKNSREITGGIPYFIFIGTLHPRKNLVTLLRAFDMFRASSGKPFKLLVVGARFFLTGEIDRIYKNLIYKSDVVFTGWMDPPKLAAALAGAEALVFVPFYEGFGIPVIEAMNCDVPVIASNVTSLPEVAGEAALYANPEKPEEIRTAMLRMVFEPGLRENLIEKGRVQRTRYSWDKTAEGLWNLILSAFPSK